MRTLTFLAICVFLSSVANGQSPPSSVWLNDVETAKLRAQQTGKLVLVHLWAPWCAPCKALEASVFNQPGFEQAITTMYVPVKVNVDSCPTMVAHYSVNEIPADLILMPDGRLVDKVQSPGTLVEYLTLMKQISQRVQPQLPPQTAPQYAAAAGIPATMTGYAAGQAGAPATDAPTYAPAQPGMGLAPGTPPAYGQAMPQNNANPGGNPYAAPGTPNYAPAGTMPQPNMMAENAGPPPAYANHNAIPANNLPAQSMPPNNYGAPNNYAPPSAAAPLAQNMSPAGGPAGAPAPGQPAPYGLDAFCPVTLCERHEWTPGNREWGVQYRGRTYLFATPEAKQKFWQNPDRYAPVASGLDPVLAIDQRQEVAGHRTHGVFFEDRVYLFSNEQSLEAFKQNPDRYAAEILQARR